VVGRGRHGPTLAARAPLRGGSSKLLEVRLALLEERLHGLDVLG
jgi:hypothetical protein